MTGMDYDEAAAERLEAVYLGGDIVNQRLETRRCLQLQQGESVLDIGSGPGFLVQEMADEVGPCGHVHGVDLSTDMIHRAEARNRKQWVSYREADATALPFENDTFDVMVSTQVAEYIPDVRAFCNEVFRVLKPGGRGVIVATDWSTVAWYSDHQDRMARILSAFRPHCAHAELPRTLAPVLRDAGFTVDKVFIYPILNTDWNDDNYSTKSAEFVAAYVRGQKSVSEEEVQAWQMELPSLANEGRYYFSLNRTFFELRKP